MIYHFPFTLYKNNKTLAINIVSEDIFKKKSIFMYKKDRSKVSLELIIKNTNQAYHLKINFFYT